MDRSGMHVGRRLGRRLAPLPAVRPSGGSRVAPGGSVGNTHGLLVHFQIAEPDVHNCRNRVPVSG